VFLAVGVAVITLAGCSASPQSVNPYAAQFAQAAEDAQSDYVRSILAKGTISASDLKDAEQHDVACLAGAGIDASYKTNEWGIDQLTVVSAKGETSDEMADQANCDAQWMGPILTLYTQQYTNPDNQDWNGLVAACLVRKGLAPSGFTGQDYANLIGQNGTPFDSSSMTPDSNGIINITATAPATIVIPGGGSLSDPTAVACTVVPLQ